MTDEPRVSVVMAARDAEATVADALDSLRAQTERRWEAVVVDDGSTDATAAVAQRAAAGDDRIRLVRRPAEGVSAARTAGLAATRAPWALFLDADDGLESAALALLGGALAADPALDAAYGAWTRVSAGGAIHGQRVWPAPEALFAALARRPVLPINSVLVRRALVDAVGGFDPALEVGEGWDLWQRLARAGARFGLVEEPVAVYRFRLGAASNDPERLLAGAVELIRRGHRADARVPRPLPEHAAGRPAHDLPSAVLAMTCWCAGLAIGRGSDPSRLLDRVPGDAPVDLDPGDAGQTLLDALVLAREDPRAALGAAGDLEPAVTAFLAAAEARTGSPHWGARVARAVERATLDRHGRRPLRAGATLAMDVELGEPIGDATPPGRVERVRCDLALEGRPLSSVELPVCDGTVPAWVIADAAAAACFWEVLGRFFARTLYPADAGAEHHDRAGWTVFLQELWGRPGWPEEAFYEDGEPSAEPAVQPTGGWVVVEAGGELADVEASDGVVDVVLTVGGAPVCRARVGAENGTRIAAGRLRAALIAAGRLELCRVAVREALLGRPLDAAGTLGERLAAAARARARLAAVPGPPSAAAGWEPAPGWEAAIAAAHPEAAPVLVLARHGGPPRRAALPGAAAEELIAAARGAGEPALALPAGAVGPRRALHVPELLWRPAGGRDDPPPPPDDGESRAAVAPRPHDRHAFEALFAGRPDPWRYETPYEQGKYDQTLAMLPASGVGRALEAGCAEGHFTVRLAARAREVVAADISSLALERAAERCAGLANVSFVQMDLGADAIAGSFDAIVASEVLYFVPDLTACAARLAGALRPGGHLVAAHANVLADDPGGPGFDWDFAFGARTIGATLEAAPGLRLVRELRTPYYRVQLLRRDRRVEPLRRKRPAEVFEAAARASPRPEVQATFRPAGGEAAPAAPPAPAVTTERLPILVYHRIADDGPQALERYRVAPRAFDAQLAYLRSAGFHGVPLAEWVRAAAVRRPLPGRAVAITFDDGYRDFAAEAWPILRRHGFGADVFLVTDAVGGTSSWDRRYGEPAPLLDWDDVARLEGEGVRFGSHTASHAPLTALGPEEAVRELARSRAALLARLRTPPTAIAYPLGDVDAATAHLAGACGYGVGLSCETARARPAGDPLRLPRIEVGGSLTLASFIAALG